MLNCTDKQRLGPQSHSNLHKKKKAAAAIVKKICCAKLTQFACCTLSPSPVISQKGWVVWCCVVVHAAYKHICVIMQMKM